jgi:hypothetical protein
VVSAETVVFECENRGPKVKLRIDPDGRARIVLDDGSRQLAFRPDHAAQLASGIDVALSRIDRNGRPVQRRDK